jgi:hypothetical protein
MYSQYDFISLRDHIADFLIFLSSAPSNWFLLNTSYDDGSHLASRFHLDPEDYKVVSPPSRRPLVVSLCQLVVASPLAVLSLSHPSVILLHCHPLIAPLSCSHVTPAGCCIASCHHLVPTSSHRLVVPACCHIASRCPLVAPCTTLSSSHRTGWLLRPLSMRRPLVILLPCCAALLSSCSTSLLSHHHLSSSSRCDALSSSHRAGWLLHSLSLHHPLVLSSSRPSLPHHSLAVVCVKCPQMLLPPSNATTTAAIEGYLYCPLLPQLPSIATIKCQHPPLSITLLCFAIRLTIVITYVCWLPNRKIYITGNAPSSTSTVIYLCHFW